jgi:hypothetical protein
MMSKSEAARLGNQLRVFRPLLSWQEERLLDRYAQALARGEHRSARATARACKPEMDELHERHPDALWASSPRSLISISHQITHRATVLGARWPGSRLLPGELKMAERYAQAFLRGEYPDVRAAAHACQDEIYATEFGRAGSVRYRVRRPYFGVYSHVLDFVRETGWSEVSRYWSEPEMRAAARFTRDLLRGRYANAAEATRACKAHFDRLRAKRPKPKWLAERRDYLGIWIVITRLAHEQGWAGRPEFWSAAATRLVDRHVRRVLDGTCPTMHAATLAFLREAKGQRPRRTYRSVMWKMGERARLMGKEPEHIAWTPDEDRLLDRFIRAMVAGRLGTARSAARAFVDDPGRLGCERTGEWPRRTLDAAVHRVLNRTDERGPATKRPWSAAEQKLAGKWARSYQRNRRTGNFRALGDAAAGLRKDLQAAGYTRTHTSCLRLVLRSRSQH